MNKRVDGGNLVLEKLSPKEVNKLKDDEVIIVNRVRINSRLVNLELQGEINPEILGIIRAAIDNIMSHEEKTKSVTYGAKMAVKDIKKVFPNIDKMPANSFAKFGNCI